MCIYVSMGLYTGAQCPQARRRVLDSPVAGVTDIYELPDMGTVNQSRFLCESSVNS